MYTRGEFNAFIVIVLLSLIIIFLYGLGLLHLLACSSNNQILLTVISYIENILGISYTLGTHQLNSYALLANCGW